MGAARRAFTDSLASCCRCNRMLPFSSFRPDLDSAIGLFSWCRECSRVDARKRFAEKKAAGKCWKHGSVPALPGKSWCQACKDDSRRKRIKRYGLTLEDYDRILAEQGGGCAICGATAGSRKSRSQERRRLVVDHCHKTGVVRGILCGDCNTGIGLLGDDPERIASASNYLAARRKS